MEDKVPKYYALKKALIAKIDNEEYGPGEMIPSESRLIEYYQLSRITVRKAIDELVNEGYLYKVQGKGTYVKGNTYNQNLYSIASGTEDVLKQGMVPSKRLIEASSMFPDSKRCRALNITKEDRVFCLKRVQLADQEELNYTITYIPEKLVPGIDSHDFSKESLYDVLEHVYGIKITKATRTFEAILATEEAAEYLHISEGMPVILFECVTYGKVNGSELPVETFKCYYRTDKWKFCINQVR